MKNNPLTLEKFKTMFPKNTQSEEIFKIFQKYFSKYEINTTNRRAMFLAQCSHESNGFSVFKENLNYSVEGLLKIFSKYFKTQMLAQKYARNPEKIANLVYANRYGNGTEASGDGFKYRGRGILQLTFKNNYLEFAKFKGITLPEVVDYLETLEGAIESALWYWKTRKLNSYCDRDDIIGATKAINGGLNGIEDRTSHYEKFKIILEA